MKKYSVQGQNIYLLTDNGEQEPGRLVAIAVTEDDAIQIIAQLQALENFINKPEF